MDDYSARNLPPKQASGKLGKLPPESRPPPHERSAVLWKMIPTTNRPSTERIGVPVVSKSIDDKMVTARGVLL
jgi:hypothetical protein